MLDEFYNTITSIGISAASGEGIDKLFEAFDTGAKEHITTYLPELERRIAEKAKKDGKQQQEDLRRLATDMGKVTLGKKHLKHTYKIFLFYNYVFLFIEEGKGGMGIN